MSQRRWDRWAAAYPSLAGRPLNRWRHRAVAVLAPVAGETILLAGCGPGFELPWLPPGSPVIACDFSAAMLRRAPRGPGRLLLQADAMLLPLADGSVDAVLLSFICAVADDGAAVLAEACRVVRPGGRVVLLDKLRPGSDGPGWRLLAAATGWVGSDFNRPAEAVLRGAAGVELTSDACGPGSYLRLLRFDRPLG